MLRAIFLFVIVCVTTAVTFYNNPNVEVDVIKTTLEMVLNRVEDSALSNPVQTGVSGLTGLVTVLWCMGLLPKKIKANVQHSEEKDNRPETVRRAEARALKGQLINDQIGLENRARKLPQEIQDAQKIVNKTAKDLTDAEYNLRVKQVAYEKACEKLSALKTEDASIETQLVEMALEIDKLTKITNS